MVLFFVGTKFHEFYEYQFDCEIRYPQKRTFMGVHKSEYPVIFREKSKVTFKYTDKMDLFKKKLL